MKEIKKLKNIILNKFKNYDIYIKLDYLIKN